MPQVHTYIRNEDMDKWKALPNKSEFIHDALGALQDIPMAYDPVKKEVLGKPVKDILTTIPGVVKGSDFVPKPPDPETGYPCCTRAKPCKHWVWDDTDTVWRNTLTDKTKED